MKRYSERSSQSTLSDINVTPLLDLAFVLLIIFMIATPLLEEKSDLIAPTSDAAQTQLEPNEVSFIFIDQNNAIEFEELVMNLPQLEARLRTLKESNQISALVVKAHRDISVQNLVSVMDAAQRAGIIRVGVVTRPDSPSDQPEAPGIR